MVAFHQILPHVHTVHHLEWLNVISVSDDNILSENERLKTATKQE